LCDADDAADIAEPLVNDAHADKLRFTVGIGWEGRHVARRYMERRSAQLRRSIRIINPIKRNAHVSGRGADRTTDERAIRPAGYARDRVLPGDEGEC